MGFRPFPAVAQADLLKGIDEKHWKQLGALAMEVSSADLGHVLERFGVMRPWLKNTKVGRTILGDGTSQTAWQGPKKSLDI